MSVTRRRRGHAFGFGIAGPPDPPEIAVNAVLFDGSNDRLLRGAALTGQADGTKFLGSFWFKVQGDPGASSDIVFHGPPGSKFFLQLQTDSKWNLLAQTAGGSDVWQFVTTPLYDTVNNPGWHNMLFSRDATGTDRHLYIDDVLVAFDTDTANAGTINFNNATNWAIGAFHSGGNEIHMDIAEFYINMAEYLDLSVVDNRRKFISANKKPVNIGTDGSIPTGNAPIIYLSGPTVDWHTNKGAGGGFTEVGALTDASSSPSD